MIQESQELLKRMDRMLQADSRETLLDEVEQFLEDMQLDEEAKKARLLDKIGSQFETILKHLVLIYAFGQSDPQYRNLIHWRDIELHTACNRVIRFRRRIQANIKNEDMYTHLKEEMEEAYTDVGRELKRYPQPFVHETFNSLKISGSPFSKYVDQFLSSLSACNSEEDVGKLMTDI
jgi:hypothetical protein